MSGIIIVSTDVDKTGSRILTFDIPRKEILSSNVQVHFRVKPKLVRQLRQAAVTAGLNFHSDNNVDLVKSRISALQDRTDWQTKKANVVKALRKKGLTKKEIEQHPDILAIGDKTSYTKVNAIENNFLYQKATIEVLIGNTVNRDFDPPNFWPTVKAITDGLTDCGWWEDDNFNYLTKVSFGCGEKSDIKGHYRLTLIVSEVNS